MTRHRPIGITILAILSGIAAVIAGIHTLQYLHLFPFFAGPFTFFGFDLWGALLWGVMFAIYLWVMRMLWDVDPQGWLFLVILSALNIGLALLSAIGGSTLALELPAIIVSGAVLLYCLTPGVKRAFGEPAIRTA
jgi:The Golgi pH Regulator (GPHR) Family N-terminal